MTVEKVIGFIESNFKKVYLESKVKTIDLEEDDSDLQLDKLHKKISVYNDLCEFYISGTTEQEFNRVVKENNVELTRDRQFKLINSLGYKLSALEALDY